MAMYLLKMAMLYFARKPVPGHGNNNQGNHTEGDFKRKDWANF